jgi:hypothetical protein
VSRYFDKVQKEFALTRTGSRKSPKTDAILISLAETIGSTLGSLAAKAEAAQKAATKALKKSKATAERLDRGGKKLVRKGKRATRSAQRGSRSASGKRARRRARTIK